MDGRLGKYQDQGEEIKNETKIKMNKETKEGRTDERRNEEWQ